MTTRKKITNKKKSSKKTSSKIKIDEEKIFKELQQPSTQFIKQAYQFNIHARVLSDALENIHENLKIKGISSISHRTGTGFLINFEGIGTSNLNIEDFIEVVDYDPIRNNLMVIGNKPPGIDSVLHWFIYRGLPDVNAIIFVNQPEVIDRFREKKVPSFEYQDKILSTDLALRVLKSVIKNNITILNGKVISVVVFLGKTLNDALNMLKFKD